MSKNLKTDWFISCKTPEEKKDLEYVLQNNPILFNAILDILDRMENEESRQETSSVQYESPSWAYQQADRNGAKRMINKVRALFTI